MILTEKRIDILESIIDKYDKDSDEYEVLNKYLREEKNYYKQIADGEYITTQAIDYFIANGAPKEFFTDERIAQYKDITPSLYDEVLGYDDLYNTIANDLKEYSDQNNADES